ncbi:MAG: ABC transporter permease, partial [Candidatus Micrarchaeaceae archaeon]
MANLIDTVYTLWLREMKRFSLSKSRIAGSLAQPFIWIAIIGVGLSSAFNLSQGGSYLTFMASGIIGMTILFTSIFAGISVIWDKQFGFLKEILVAPVSRWGIVLGKIAGSTTISMLTALIVLVAVIAVGIIPLSGLTVLGIILALVFMVLISSTFVSFGLVIAAKLNNIE